MYFEKHVESIYLEPKVYNKSKGYFIEPTTILTTDPNFKTMEEEIFGPVLTIYIYNCSCI